MNKGVLKAESRCVGKHTTVNLSSSSSSKRTPRTGQHGNDSEEKSRSQSHDGEVDFADTSEANSTKGESFLSPDSLSSSLRLDQQSQVTFGGEEDKSQPSDDDYATASVDPNFYQQVHFTPSRHATPSSVYSPYSPHSPFSPFTYATSGNVVFFQDSQARPDLVPQQYSQLDNPNLTAELDPGMFDEAYARTLYNSDVLQFNGNLNEVHAVVGAVQQSVNDLMEVVAYDDCHEGDRQRYAEMFNNAFDPDALIRQHMMELSAEDFVMYNAVNILTQEGIRAAAEFDEDEPPALEQMPSNHHSPLYPMYPQYQQYPQTFAAPTPIPVSSLFPSHYRYTTPF